MLPNWTEHDLTVNGIQLHYTRTGGAKPPFVLAHGFSDNGQCWLPTVLELQDEYDILLPDARAHGKSARVSPGEKIDMPGDLANFITALGLTGVVLGGHSMGASTSARTAALIPERLKGLILEDPAWRHPPAVPPPPPDPTAPNPWIDFLLKAKTMTTEQVMAHCRAESPTWAEIELRPWAESKQQFDTGIFQAENMLFGDFLAEARAIRCPTLLLTADADKGAIVTPEAAAEASAANPLIQVANIPGVGHNIRREAFPAFLKAVRSFLASLA
jgi:pimeloyl-ACP methyl ester carboxylesterase